ncbi:hypothetical protein H9N28_02640 [Rhodobacter capsulatus]|uniref:hypothetical protein n=1 Tax=Rhodobacter capsulatus TaxID=1061 RepID=UPI0011BD1A1F|nr:hypothetical protein [Rhodobacter capsulatus]QNR63759.1 hypothetical protein H9N28_02640 [Rhodobacter capsulatus]
MTWPISLREGALLPPAAAGTALVPPLLAAGCDAAAREDPPETAVTGETAETEATSDMTASDHKFRATLHPKASQIMEKLTKW